MLRQKTRKKTRKIAQFINLLVIEPGRPGADFCCIVIPQPQPFADRLAALLWLTYSSFKCSFHIEPYLNLVRNCNQKCQLYRLRVSAHRLGGELQRYSRPQIPRDKRYCKYCPPTTGSGGEPVRPVDSECHCLTDCIVSRAERSVLFDNMSSRNSNFSVQCNVEKFKYLCALLVQLTVKKLTDI